MNIIGSIESSGQEIYSIGRFKRALSILTKRRANKSILIRGVHGIGKSSIIKQWAKDKAKELGLEFIPFTQVSLSSIQRVINPDIEPVNDGKIQFDCSKHFLFYDIRASQRDQVDFIGAIDKSVGITRFIPTDWIVLISQPNIHGVILLDEIDQATKNVQNALFEFIHDRRINSNEISDHIYVFAAGNSGTGSSLYGLKPMSAALVDRFWMVTLSPTVDEWIEWARSKNKTSYNIAATFFSDDSKKMYLDYPSDNKVSDAVYQSRRSWADFCEDFQTIIEQSGLESQFAFNKEESYFSIPKEFDISLANDVALGYLGSGTSAKFVEYLRNSLPSITLDDILKGNWNPEDMPRNIDITTSMEAFFKGDINDYIEFVGNDDAGRPHYRALPTIHNLAKFLEDCYEYSHEISTIVKDMFMLSLISCKSDDVNARIEHFQKWACLAAHGGIEYGRLTDDDGPLMHILATISEKEEFKNDGLETVYRPIYSDWAKKKNAERNNYIQSTPDVNLYKEDDTKIVSGVILEDGSIGKPIPSLDELIEEMAQ
jgi:MoxR-like ATPase